MALHRTLFSIIVRDSSCGAGLSLVACQQAVLGLLPFITVAEDTRAAHPQVHQTAPR